MKRYKGSAVHDRSTDTDAASRGVWAIDDHAIRLREWGTERVYSLAPMTIGSSADCELRIEDTSGQVSRRHAHVVADGGSWKIRDLQSKNGLWRDGIRVLECVLEPGIVIGIGGVRLVAESPRLIALRGYMSRLLGFSSEAQNAVDEAMRSLRLCGCLQSSLVLCGGGDLVPIARKFHEAILPANAPFLVYDRAQDELLRKAYGGTICMIAPAAKRVPGDATKLLADLRDPANRARFMLCAPSAAAAAKISTLLVRASLVEVPSPGARDGELERMILESADDAARELGAPATGLTMSDLDRLAALDYPGLAEVSDTVRRVVALRTWGLVGGAARIGVTHPTLFKWAQRRGLHT